MKRSFIVKLVLTVFVTLSIADVILLNVVKRNKEIDTTTTTDFSEIEERVDSDYKDTYIAIADEAVSNITDDTVDKTQVRKDAIYTAIISEQGIDIANSIVVTREEALAEINKNTFPKIQSVFNITQPEEYDDEGNVIVEDVVTSDYYVYEGSPDYTVEEIKELFPLATAVEKREPTLEDSIEEAKKSIASRQIVEEVTRLTEKVMK